MQQLIDDILGQYDEPLNYEDLYENTIQVLTSPLDLNTATAEELSALQVLRDEQLQQLLAYRSTYGPFIDIHELQAVPGFHPDDVRRLLPFVRLVDPSTRIDKSLVRRMFSGNSYVLWRYERTLEKKKGFKTTSGAPPAFAGSADKLYFRMRSSIPGDFSFGITGEKDEGEPVRFDRWQWGFDFTSAHVQLKNKGRLKTLVIGDFQTQFAQGLLLGGAFGIGKGGGTVNVRKGTTGFQPYTSVYESGYLRGIATTWCPVPFLDISAFYSGTRRDASANTEDDSTQVHALQRTGLHRTVTERSNMKSIREQNAGVAVKFAGRRMEGGLIAHYIHFDPQAGSAKTLYNRFSFRGNANLNAGIFLDYRLGNLSFFGEAGRSWHGGSAFIGGVLLAPAAELDVAVVVRKYSRNFFPFYSNAISESTRPQNENGVYWTWQYRWNRRYSMSGSLDLFAFPWLGFRRYAPSMGHEWSLRGEYRPSRDARVFLQVRRESKESNLGEPSGVYRLGERIRQSVVLNLDYGVRGNVTMKSRIQYNAQTFNGTFTEGWAIVQDVSVRAGRFELSARHGLFQTDHFDNRLYVYERDVSSAYSIPAYGGIGVRKYAVIEYKASKTITLWLRYARTRMLLDGEIGSGQDAIDGNRRNDVKFQARFTF